MKASRRGTPAAEPGSAERGTAPSKPASARIDGDRGGPRPASETGYSGRFNLRLPRSLHRRLAASAEQEGVSLNQYVVGLLAAGETEARIERRLRRLETRLRAIQSRVGMDSLDPRRGLMPSPDDVISVDEPPTGSA